MYNIYKNNKFLCTVDKKSVSLEELEPGSHVFSIRKVLMNDEEGEEETVRIDIPNTSTEKLVSINQYATGAGWYELPDGYKVRGKKKAEEYLKGLLI